MKLSVASVIAFAGSAAAFQAPTMVFSFGKKGKKTAAAKGTSCCKWEMEIVSSNSLRMWTVWTDAK